MSLAIYATVGLQNNRQRLPKPLVHQLLTDFAYPIDRVSFYDILHNKMAVLGKNYPAYALL